MWDYIAVSVIVILVFCIGVYRSLKSGDLRKLVDFMKLASTANNDLFDGASKTFVLKQNDEERTVQIKTINDAVNIIFTSRNGPSTLYFGPQLEEGLHLEFSVYNQHNDDFMKLVEKDGAEVIRTLDFNLDKSGPGQVADVLVNLIGRMGNSTTTWWDEKTA